jgi:hypothetical protein
MDGGNHVQAERGQVGLQERVELLVVVDDEDEFLGGHDGEIVTRGAGSPGGCYNLLQTVTAVKSFSKTQVV